MSTFAKKVDVVDPIVDIKQVNKFDQIKIFKKIPTQKYDVIFITVGHKIFKNISKIKFLKSLTCKGFIFDFKNIFKFNEKVITF